MTTTTNGPIADLRQARCRRRLAVLLVAAACTGLAACSSGAKPAGEGASRAKPSGRAAGPHDLRAKELRDVMRAYDAAVRASVPGETDLYDRWQGVFPRMADAAAALRASATELSGHPPGKLELPDRGRFQVLARSLADAAGELEEAAARGDADAVPIARARVARACRDCHDRFRPDASGVPDAFR